MARLALYTYFRSSAAFRVRIALNFKQLSYEPRYVHLRREGGEHRRPGYRAVNPQGLVPTLLHGQQAFTQSLAIIEFLDEVYPQPALLPSDAAGRAWVRSLAQLIACDIHPLNNLRVLDYLKDELAQAEQARSAWYGHWVQEGFQALEALLGSRSIGDYCYGDAPTLADVCLVPQVYNAQRFHCVMEHYPQIQAIYDHCMGLPAFQAAAPQRQEDAE